MPRKVSYRFNDFDDDYDEFEDYDHDDIEEYDVEILETKKTTDQTAVWTCAICTYDNDESLAACDICGVLRNPIVSNKGTKRVEGICKDTGVSKMAKSLFASVQHWKPKNFQLGNFNGGLSEFHKFFSSPRNFCLSIEPFKFDVPSPDDLVNNRLHFSRASAKDFPSKKPSSVEKNHDDYTVNSVEKSNDSMLVGSKKKLVDSSELTSSKRETSGLQLVSESFSAGRCKNLEANRGLSYVTGNARSVVDISENNLATTSKGKHNSNDPDTHLGKDTLNMTCNINKLSLVANAGNSGEARRKKGVQGAQHKTEDWMLSDKASDSLVQLNLAIVGHVDSGKSTISGRLLHLLGRISKKDMHKYEKEAKLQGKGSFAYAWALDESAEERERGVTMTVAVAYFDSKKYHVVLLDSPGHKDFVPNMISGATQADAAILVIDATTGAFEASMENTKGQAREHAQVLRGFGIDQIVVAVNKMDAVGYSKDRFDMIRHKLGTYLHSCRFKDSSVTWVPLSAMENQNLVAAPSDMRMFSWYRGPSLLNAIDSLELPKRDFSSPVLMPICDVIKSSSQGHISACGKLEAGALRAGLKVLVMPSGDTGTVRSLERDSQSCAIARAGDNVAVSLQSVDASQVIAGGVLCHPDFPVSVARHLELTVLVLEGATPILMGSQLECHIHHAKEAARVVRILSILDPKTGRATKKSPRCLTAKQSAVLEVVLQDTVCVEPFSVHKALGRVFLRSMGRTIAMGKVNRVIEDEGSAS